MPFDGSLGLKRVFGTILKVEDQEDGTIKVYGVASSETRDGAGEIVRAEAMQNALPDYSRFPALREMHQPMAAGKVLEAEVDADGVTSIVAHVVDPVAIVKVRTGVYAGFSIGGKVLKRDPNDRTIITALRLIEISLVDSPCNPDAVLTMWKAELMKIDNPTGAEVVERAKALAKAEGSQRYRDFLFRAREELVAERTMEAVEKGEIELEAPASAESSTGGLATGGDEPAADERKEAAAATGENAGSSAPAKIGSDDGAEPKEAAAEAGDPDEDDHAGDGADEAAATEGEDKDAANAPDPADTLAAVLDQGLEKAGKKPKGDYGDVEYADPGYQDDKKPRYPLDSEEHIRAAWNYIHQKKNADKYTADQVKKIKAKIVAAWKAKIDKDGPPEAEKLLFCDLAKTAAALASIKGYDATKAGGIDFIKDQRLEKSLYNVSSFACLLQSFAYLQETIECEEQCEGDTTSKVPAGLAEAIANLGDLLVSYAQEEVAELVQSLKSDDDDGPQIEIIYGGDDCTMGAEIVDLVKGDVELMEKAGARHSKADQERLQAAHDNLAKMGAICDANNCGGVEAAAPAEEITSLKADNEKLRKALDDAAPAVEAIVTGFTETIDTLKGEVAELRKRFEDEPLAPKTAGPAATRAVEKGEDSAGRVGSEHGSADVSLTDEQLDKLLEGMSEHERNLMIMKAALRRPTLLATRSVGPAPVAS
jgi:phage head maturation protease